MQSPPAGVAGTKATAKQPDWLPAHVHSVCIWLAEHELWLLVFVVPVLVIAPSPLFPAWVAALALVLVPVPFLARRLAYGQFSVKTPQDVPLLLLLAMHAVGAVVTVDMSLTMLVIKRTALALAVFFFLVNTIRSQRQVLDMAGMLIAAGLIMGAVGLLGTNWSTGKVALLQEIYHRLPHIASAALNAAGFNANIVGGSLAMIVPVALGLAVSHKGWAHVVYLLAAVFLLAVVVLSQSRGALLGLAVALAIMAVAADRRFLWLAPPTAGALALAWLTFGPQSLANLFLATEGTGGTVESRLELWQRATYMIQDFPYTGIGSGTFSRVLPILYPPFLSPPDAVIPHAHQMYLQAAVDFGIPGFVAFMALLATLLLVGLDSILAANPGCRMLTAGLFAGFVVYLTHGLMDDVTFSTKAAVVLWTIAGLMVAQWRLLRTSPVAPERGAALRSSL